MLRAAVQPVLSTARMPAAWCFAVVWGAAGALLALRGDGGLLPYDVGQLTAVLVLSWVLLLATVSAEWTAESTAPWRSRLQVAVVVLAVVLTGADGMAFHRAGPAQLGSIPL